MLKQFKPIHLSGTPLTIRPICIGCGKTIDGWGTVWVTHIRPSCLLKVLKWRLRNNRLAKEKPKEANKPLIRVRLRKDKTG